jgi:CDP-paratose 2-epimerase
MEKVLITGCAGFIGFHLAKHFLELGATVVGIDNLSRKGCETNLRLLQDSHKREFEFHREDIRNFSAIEKIFKSYAPVDLVIHEAAQVAVTTSIARPREDFEINALGTFNLLEATRLHSPNAFFEFASTNKVYGKMDDLGVIERNGRYEYANLPNGVGETYGLDFHSPYGCSKGTADQYVRDYSRIYGVRTAVLRQSCIYGTRQFGLEDQGWVAWFTIASVLGKQLTIYGDGKQGRDLLWIDDLVEAYVGLYKNADNVAGQVFNVGGGPGNILSLLELVTMLKEAGILSREPAFSAWRDGDQKIFVCDTRRIASAIQWKPVVSPAQGVKRLIDWTVANKDLLSRMLG